MIRVETVRWRCEPTIAAVQVMSEAWIFDPPVIPIDLSPGSNLHKVIRITTADDKPLLCVQCTTDGKDETRVDFLLYDRLDTTEMAYARDFIGGVKSLGEVERLTRRALGFGR